MTGATFLRDGLVLGSTLALLIQSGVYYTSDLNLIKTLHTSSILIDVVLLIMLIKYNKTPRTFLEGPSWEEGMVLRLFLWVHMWSYYQHVAPSLFRVVGETSKLWLFAVQDLTNAIVLSYVFYFHFRDWGRMRILPMVIGVGEHLIALADFGFKLPIATKTVNYFICDSIDADGGPFASPMNFVREVMFQSDFVNVTFMVLAVLSYVNLAKTKCEKKRD